MRAPLKMMEDGQSTKKTLGQGLGAIKRLSNDFDLYSLHGWGTILWVRVFKNKSHKSDAEDFDINVISVSKEKETVCGDAWYILHDKKKIKISVIDGLGHGAPAHTAAQEAVRSLKLYPKKLPTDQVRSLHEDLKKTRGVVAMVAQIDTTSQQLTYSGVGNINMRVISAIRNQGCFSYNGIIGHIMPASLNNHVLQWNSKMDTIIMHSDGITSRWDIKKYPGILQHNSIMLCAALYKDHCRGNDDATILIGKIKS
jgi:serine phosphatase RsbU (regulator of sigma subunit)